jgi:hypothetical protein
MAAVLLLSVGLAKAHSFNVALLVGQSGAAARDGDQIRDGFLLATKERDSHPDEESDGHLGGLDVYLFVAEVGDGAMAGVRALLQQTTIDIMAVIAPDVSIETVRPLTAGLQTVLLAPGQTPFPASAPANTAGQTPAVRSFFDAFRAEYGYLPSPSAAQGYNAARRIDAAVRAQGGVSDQEALRQTLRESQSAFDW